MRAIGIDPGTRFLGWGVVERHGNRLVHIAHGVIAPPAAHPLAQRLVHIDAQLSEVLATHAPTEGAVESLFFYKDASAAAKLGHARGVVLVALARAGLCLAEYAPAKVKSTITGKGQADKTQVAMMIRAQLGLEVLPREDATDALAIAVTHLRIAPLLAQLEARSAGKPPHPLLAKLASKRRGSTI